MSAGSNIPAREDSSQNITPQDVNFPLGMLTDAAWAIQRQVIRREKAGLTLSSHEACVEFAVAALVVARKDCK